MSIVNVPKDVRARRPRNRFIIVTVQRERAHIIYTHFFFFFYFTLCLEHIVYIIPYYYNIIILTRKKYTKIKLEKKLHTHTRTHTRIMFKI